MKAKFTIGALIVVLMVTTGAFASSHEQTANVPFEFHVGDRVMPAGTYTIRQLSDSTLMIQKDGEKPSVALTSSAERSAADVSAKLVFRHIGDQYFLSQVWNSASESGRSLLISRHLQEVASQNNVSVDMGSK